MEHTVTPHQYIKNMATTVRYLITSVVSTRHFEKAHPSRNQTLQSKIHHLVDFSIYMIYMSILHGFSSAIFDYRTVTHQIFPTWISYFTYMTSAS